MLFHLQTNLHFCHQHNIHQNTLFYFYMLLCTVANNILCLHNLYLMKAFYRYLNYRLYYYTSSLVLLPTHIHFHLCLRLQALYLHLYLYHNESHHLVNMELSLVLYLHLINFPFCLLAYSFHLNHFHSLLLILFLLLLLLILLHCFLVLN